jgi:protein TonB
VFIEFVVNKGGSLVDFNIVKGIGSCCDEEAIRNIKEGPRWQQAMQHGKPFRQRMVIQVFFKMADLL